MRILKQKSWSLLLLQTHFDLMPHGFNKLAIHHHLIFKNECERKYQSAQDTHARTDITYTYAQPYGVIQLC